MKQTNRKSGFTLVELSIVIIIIGLLIGGILKGQELIQNARIASVISKTKSVSVAYYTFYDSYHAMPGDMSNARGGLAGCNIGSACFDGNGDNLLGIGLPTGALEAEAWYSTPADINSENTQFWKHLALANLIEGINPSASTTDWGQTHPDSALGAGFHARSSRAPSTAHGSLNGLTMVMRNSIAGFWLCDNPGRDNCAVSPSTAERIDKKADDGSAISGTVQAISSGWGNGCGIADTGINGPTGYGSNNDVKSCDIMFKIDN